MIRRDHLHHPVIQEFIREILSSIVDAERVVVSAERLGPPISAKLGTGSVNRLDQTWVEGGDPPEPMDNQLEQFEQYVSGEKIRRKLDGDVGAAMEVPMFALLWGALRTRPHAKSIPVQNASGSVVTRCGLGARGVDYIEQSSGTGMAVVFPIYDAHGNNVASLSRNGLGYQISNRRSFDAWGSVRLGSQTGDPTGRYCANLGHKQDDESGLIYMRARYYEPTSGRFLSQDPAMDGWNWFSYCGNDPVSGVDRSGKAGVWLMDLVVAGIAFALLSVGAVATAPLAVFACVAVGIAFIIKALIDGYVDGMEGKVKGLGAPWHGEDPSSYALGMIDALKQTGNCLEKAIASMAELSLWSAFAVYGEE